MQLNNEHELMTKLIEMLASEGVEAFISKGAPEHEGDEPEDVLRVPAWERPDGAFSRESVYNFLFSKLDGHPGKGLATELPGTRSLNIYAFNPEAIDDGKALNRWDILVWSAGISLDSFTWQEMVEGDDSAWWEGWDLPSELEHLPRRVGNLLILLHYKLVELPALLPLTELGLVSTLEKRGAGAELYCSSPDYKHRWSLRLSASGALVLHKQSDQTITAITTENIDDKGRLMLDGRMLIHPCWQN